MSPVRKMAQLLSASTRAFVNATAAAGREASHGPARAVATMARAAPPTAFVAFNARAAAMRRPAAGIAAAHLYGRQHNAFRGYSLSAASTDAPEGEDAPAEEAVASEAAEADAAPAAAEGIKLYIGNLPWDFDSYALEQYFGEYECTEIALVSDSTTGRSRGFAFVTVATQDVADRLIEDCDGADMGGRTIKVNVSVAKPRGDRPERGTRRRESNGPEGSWQFDGRKVYFGNLSWGMDHLDLQDLCSEFGNVEDSRLITDRETGRSRGFGFVTMASASEADEVVSQLNGQDVDGRVLRVNIANTNPPPGRD